MAASGAVVNDHEWSAASALPSWSLTPPEPPFSVAVYAVEGVSVALGSSVAVEPLPETAAGTTAPPASRSSKLLAVTLAGSIASLRTARTFTLAPTPVAPEAGATLVTVGGVVSPGSVVSNTTSTQ